MKSKNLSIAVRNHADAIAKMCELREAFGKAKNDYMHIGSMESLIVLTDIKAKYSAATEAFNAAQSALFNVQDNLGV